MNGRRLWAVMLKELRQMRRDRITLAMIVGIPVAQLLLTAARGSSPQAYEHAVQSMLLAGALALHAGGAWRSGAGYSSVAAHGLRPASGLNYKGCAIGCGKVFANL